MGTSLINTKKVAHFQVALELTHDTCREVFLGHAVEIGRFSGGELSKNKFFKDIHDPIRVVLR